MPEQHLQKFMNRLNGRVVHLQSQLDKGKQFVETSMFAIPFTASLFDVTNLQHPRSAVSGSDALANAMVEQNTTEDAGDIGTQPASNPLISAGNRFSSTDSGYASGRLSASNLAQTETQLLRNGRELSGYLIDMLIRESSLELAARDNYPEGVKIFSSVNLDHAELTEDDFRSEGAGQRNDHSRQILPFFDSGRWQLAVFDIESRTISCYDSSWRDGTDTRMFQVCYGVDIMLFSLA